MKTNRKKIKKSIKKAGNFCPPPPPEGGGQKLHHLTGYGKKVTISLITFLSLGSQFSVLARLARNFFADFLMWITQKKKFSSKFFCTPFDEKIAFFNFSNGPGTFLIITVPYYFCLRFFSHTQGNYWVMSTTKWSFLRISYLEISNMHSFFMFYIKKLGGRKLPPSDQRAKISPFRPKSCFQFFFQL